MMINVKTLSVYGVIVMRIETKEHTIVYTLEPGAARNIVQLLNSALEELDRHETSAKN